MVPASLPTLPETKESKHGSSACKLWLLVLTVLLCSVLYPLVLLGIGQTLFHDTAQGSLLTKDGKLTSNEKEAVGSRLIAQPFTADEYFQPRPSATSARPTATTRRPRALPTGRAAITPLRDRVAQQLGPIVNYAGPAAKKGQPVGPDIESWFQKDMMGGKKGIVAKWANLHGNSAQNWVKNDMINGAYGLNGKYVAEWQKSHKAEVEAWIKDNPGTPEPKPEDLAVPFFVSFSKDHPGTFPSPVAHKKADGKTENEIEPVKKASDIQQDIQKPSSTCG